MCEAKMEGKGHDEGWAHPGLGMGIDKILAIPIPLLILLTDPIPYRFSYRFSLGKEKKKKSTNGFININFLLYNILWIDDAQHIQCVCIHLHILINQKQT